MPDWTPEDNVILLDYYFNSPENTHTDSHLKCQQLAAQLNRTPGAIDMRLRNARSIQEQRGLPHAASELASIMEKFGFNGGSVQSAADEIRAVRGIERVI